MTILTDERRERKRAKDRTRRARPAASAKTLFDRLMAIPAFVALDDAAEDALAEGIEAIVSEREEQR